MSQPFQHAPKFTGGPCTRCGLAYSPKAAYIACFQSDDTLETWFARLNDAQRDELPEPLRQLLEARFPSKEAPLGGPPLRDPIDQG